MVPECKSSDTGSSDVSKRSHKPLSEKVKAANLVRKGSLLSLLKSMVRRNLLSVKLQRSKKKFVLVVLLRLKLHKL